MRSRILLASGSARPSIWWDSRRSIRPVSVAESRRQRKQLLGRWPLPPEKGCARYRRPAKEGSIGCPHVQGTVEAAVSLGLPTVQTPPDLGATPIKLCQQGSVTIHKEAFGKLDQPYYWGSRIWAKIYGLRTHVEGFFGSLKNPSTEAIGRGHHRLVGLANVSIVAAVGSAACNIRLLRKNAEELRALGYNHILIAEDQEGFGIKLLSEDEANEIDARYAGADAYSSEACESKAA